MRVRVRARVRVRVRPNCDELDKGAALHLHPVVCAAQDTHAHLAHLG